MRAAPILAILVAGSVSACRHPPEPEFAQPRAPNVAAAATEHAEDIPTHVRPGEADHPTSQDDDQ